MTDTGRFHGVRSNLVVFLVVLVYVLLGDRAVGAMTRAQQQLARRQPGVKVYAILVLAAMLILDAISLRLICPCNPAMSASEIRSVATPTARPSMEIEERNAVCLRFRADQR